MKPVEYWIALGAASAYVFMNTSVKSLGKRSLITGISAGFGFSLTPELSEMTKKPEILTMVVTTCSICLILDFATAMIADRDAVVALVKRVLKR